MKPVKRIFCVPYNGDYYGVENMVKDYGDHIYEFYGIDGQFPSAKTSFDYRKNRDSRIHTLKETVKFLNEKNIKFNYLLNDIFIENYIENLENIKRLLKGLKDIGVESITLSYPYLISHVKETGLKVVHSVLQNVYSEIKIKYLLEYGGGDRFIIHGNYVRQISILKYLKKIIPENSFLEIPVNLKCRLDCPNEIMHYSYRDDAFCGEFCRKSKRSLEDWLKRVWVRYKDIEKYQSIGIDFFKITERSMPSKTIHNYLGYFVNGIMTNPDQLSYSSYFKDELTGTIIDDTELDNYFDFIFSEPGCTGRCTECGNYCNMFVDKLKRKYNLEKAFMKQTKNFI
jgi:collagenase-like PrtC family protease